MTHANDEPDLATIEAYLDIVASHGRDSAAAAAFRRRNAGVAGFADFLADANRFEAACRRRERVRRLDGCLNVLAIVTLVFAVGLACWWWGVRYGRNHPGAHQPAPAPVVEEMP